MNKSLSFDHGFKIGTDPKDLAVATTGDRIFMGKGERLTILLIVAAGTAATITPQLKQHDAASAGTSKALSITNPYLIKKGAETVFTKVDPGVAYDNVVLGATIGTGKAVVAFEVMPGDLDLANGFGYVSLDLPVAGVARLGSVLLAVTDSKIKPAYLETL